MFSEMLEKLRALETHCRWRLNLVCNRSITRQRIKLCGPHRISLNMPISMCRLSYPSSKAQDFEIGYGTRIGSAMDSEFKFYSLKWRRGAGWERSELKLPTSSAPIAIWGSGAQSVTKWRERWERSSQQATSRAIFGAFCDAVLSKEDPRTGGTPQLIGLTRIGAARAFGYCDKTQATICGALVTTEQARSVSIECRNRLFELCGPDGNRLSRAQTHMAPRGLAGS
jgi:hypothetical protein